MKRLHVFVALFFVFAFLSGGSASAAGMSNAQAKKIMTGWFNQGGFPMEWGHSYMGSKLKQLDGLEIKKVKQIKVPGHLASQCENVWITVVHAKGVSRTNNGPVIGDKEYLFDKQGTFIMCLTFQDSWMIALSQ